MTEKTLPVVIARKKQSSSGTIWYWECPKCGYIEYASRNEIGYTNICYACGQQVRSTLPKPEGENDE